MKSVGVVRKVDELGRIVIPIELRRAYEISIGDPLEIYVNEDQIILKKYKPQHQCMITGDVSDKNFTLANRKINLSPEGANLLKKELEKYLEKV
ncbi:AbrB/MazE/SpoVT family DNA-binding domain-containing protein [Metabacillus niabensis]|uniref:AbrB/MazE/SpoVT family DNA-binding domain-containing protein n=1 Tax=Metabacillus niabensis TaxID=324854 RepID=UPI001CFC3CB9|nr:AbrB/MazE/SpoVT family DNA-binding domain-containing protein [Metabacillus niabensis]